MQFNICKYILLIYILLYAELYTYENRLYVELSAATLSYIIYLPIVVKSWNFIGYHAIVIITYHKLDNRILYISNIIKNLGNEIVMINFNSCISLDSASKMSRIYGFLVSKELKESDYFILSDADIIPVSKHFFLDFNYNNFIIKSLGPQGYGYGNNRGRWTICYMIASKYIWKEVLKEDIKPNNLNIILSNVIKRQISKGKKYFESFSYIDEVYLRDKLKSWNKFDTNVIFHKRNFNNTRIDRSKWPGDILSINKDNIIDIHLPKLENNIMSVWKSKIIPLQLFLYNYIPYGEDYIQKILSFN